MCSCNKACTRVTVILEPHISAFCHDNVRIISDDLVPYYRISLDIDSNFNRVFVRKWWRWHQNRCRRRFLCCIYVVESDTDNNNERQQRFGLTSKTCRHSYRRTTYCRQYRSRRLYLIRFGFGLAATGLVIEYKSTM